MATKEYNLDLDVKGSISATTVPNSTGSVVTWNATTNVFGLRSNAQIISDLGVSTALNNKANVNGDNITNIQTWRDSLGIGTLNSLTTTNKSNLVNAINEVKGSVPSVTGLVPYTGANQAVNLNTQSLTIGGDFNKNFSNFERSQLHSNTTGATHFTRLTDVASFSRGSDSTTQSDCVVITLPIRDYTRWVMEVDIFSVSSGDIFVTPTKLLISAYLTNNIYRSVTAISNADNVKSVSFCRDTDNNTVIIIRSSIEGGSAFNYGKANIANFYHGVYSTSSLSVKSNYRVEAVLESSLTGLTTNGTITNAQFTRDSYLWNKGNFSQTDINNWNTSFGWGRGLRVDNNSEAVHNSLTLNAHLVKNSSIFLNSGSANIPNYGPNRGAPVVNFTPYKAGSSEYGFSISARLNRLFFNTTELSVVDNWLEIYHTDNFNPAQYVLQSSLNTQLANYVPINGVTTINNTKTFTSSPIVPNATLNNHAVNLGQLNSILDDYATETWVAQEINNISIPTVNDGQLTLTTGTGLSGSANFTANQSGNSSFSVSVASTHKLPTTAEWNALPTTNTTYTAGTGLSLTGTVFGQTITTSGTGTFVTGITQTTNGFQVNLGTPPNTTYTAGSGLTLSGTTFSLPITYSGTGDYIANIVQNTNGLTVTRATLPTLTDAITSVSRNGVNIPIVSQNVDIPVFSTTGAGLVPARVGSVATKYLREDGTWVTPSNTTYTSGTLAILNTGTSATNQLWSSLILNQWLIGKGYLTEVTEASNSSVGGMKLASDIPGGTPNPVSNVANRWYAVQRNDEGHGVVNIPWIEGNSVSNFITSDTDQSDLTGNKITAGKWIFKGSSNHHIETLTDSATVNSIASGLSFRWHDSDWRVGNMRGLSTDSLGLTLNLNGAEKVRITASSDIVTTSFGAASNWIQAWQWGNHATAGYIKRNTSNVVDSYSFSLDGIGGALTMSPQGLTLIGSDSTNPDSENWDSNFEVSLEEKLFRMWSTANGNGFSFSLNEKGSTDIKIPDSEAPFSQKVLPLKFTMNGAAYEADANGLVALPNSVSNTTFTNNAQNSTTQNQTVTLTNTTYPRIERVFYGGTANGTLTLNKYNPVDGDEIIVQGSQCSVVIKKSSTVSHAIYTADQFNPVYVFRLAEQSFTSPSIIRQFVHLRYMANYQAWVVLSASLR